MDGLDDLSEELSGVRLFESPSHSDIRMQVGRARREQKVNEVVRHDDLADRVDVRMTVDAVMSGQQTQTRRIVRSHLK